MYIGHPVEGLVPAAEIPMDIKDEINASYATEMSRIHYASSLACIRFSDNYSWSVATSEIMGVVASSVASVKSGIFVGLDGKASDTIKYSTLRSLCQ
jgi:hypothetical protein